MYPSYFSDKENTVSFFFFLVKWMLGREEWKKRKEKGERREEGEKMSRLAFVDLT